MNRGEIKVKLLWYCIITLVNKSEMVSCNSAKDIRDSHEIKIKYKINQQASLAFKIAYICNSVLWMVLNLECGSKISNLISTILDQS